MTNEFIMQMRPWFGEEEKKAIADYMDEDGFLTEFKHTERFENCIAEYTRAKHCVVVNNGTISLTLSALALGLQPGDEVIVPNYTMIAGPNSLLMVGIKPIFCDVCPETLCLSIEQIRRKISHKTKAVMLMDANGREPKEGIEAFVAFCKEENLYLLEDAAQGLGSRYRNGKHLGVLADIASFSFSAPKIISTGQGGAIITESDELASKLRRLKDFGRASGGNDTHDSIGFNFKFTEMQAVIGLAQFKKLGARVKRKKQIYLRYKEALACLEEVKMFECDTNFTAPWFYDFMVEDREGLIDFLKSRGIGSRVMYPPINRQGCYRQEGLYPVANDVGRRGLWLPSQAQLTDNDVDYICHTVTQFYQDV